MLINKSQEKVKIIIDTDLGADCDDAGAIAIAHALADYKEAKILAITHCTSVDSAVGTIDAINNYYGRNIPVGAYKKDGFLDIPGQGIYSEYVHKHFPHKYQTRADAPDSLNVLRKTLSENISSGIVLVAIGPLNNIAELLTSKPCQYSKLTGVELVKASVEKLVIMGGFFGMDGDVYWGDKKMDAEYNIICDIPAAQKVMKLSPVPIVLSTYEIGAAIKTGLPLVKSDRISPVRSSYEVYCAGDRESWDLTAVLFAIRGASPYWKLSNQGTIRVDDKGITTFTEGTGNHSYLIPDCDTALVETELNNLLLKLPTIERRP